MSAPSGSVDARVAILETCCRSTAAHSVSLSEGSNMLTADSHVVADAGGHLSPSLGGEGTAYEQKFLVTPHEATQVAAWARGRMFPDPHGDPVRGYRIQTLYLDTPNLETFRRSGWYATRKFRIRRYGDESQVWLERKRKRKDRVRKTRELASPELLMDLRAPESEAGGWFRRECIERQLRPVCEVHYQRLAWSTGGARLTIDENLHARFSEVWRVGDDPDGSVEFDPDLRILELKFRDHMPAIFRILLQEFDLRVTTFSKYRTAVESVVPIDMLGNGPAAIRKDGTISQPEC